MQNAITPPKSCRACNAELTEHNNNFTVQGFIAGTEYEITECGRCKSLLAGLDNESNLPKLYDSIYKNIELISGYKRYLSYSNIGDNKYLGKLFDILYSEMIYFGTSAMLKGMINENNHEKKIFLEIGCGLGYTTSALRKIDLNVVGYDISVEATDLAREKYGGEFLTGSLENLISKYPNKFDGVIILEVIEHMDNPFQYLQDVKKLLKNNGSIILTTPNRKNEYSWNTTEPPVHLSYFTPHGIFELSRRLNAKSNFVVKKYDCKNKKKKDALKNINLPGGVLTSDLKPNANYFDNGKIGAADFIKLILINWRNKLFNYKYQDVRYLEGEDNLSHLSQMDTIIVEMRFE